jgi:hypothetical protein
VTLDNTGSPPVIVAGYTGASDFKPGAYLLSMYLTMEVCST